MRKRQMVECFQILERIEEADDPAEAVAELRTHLESVRAQWWEDSTKVFHTLCKMLDAYYRESWSPEFRETEKRTKATRRYANLILDQIRQSWPR